MFDSSIFDAPRRNRPDADALDAILVVKFGGPDRFIAALPALARLRLAHRSARIILATDAAMGVLAADSPYVDGVVTDPNPEDPRTMRRIATQLRGQRFACVVDLEGGASSERIVNALRPLARDFVSTVRTARYHVNPRALEGQHPIDAALTRVAVLGGQASGDAIPDVRWAVTARRGAPSLRPAFFGLSTPYVLICPDAPGGEASAIWPIAHFAGLAARLLARGVGVGVASSPRERGAARAIAAACPGVRDVAARADYTQLAALAASAAGAFGHAGGALMPLLAAAGAPTLVMVTSGADAGKALRGKSVISMLAPTPGALTADYAADAVSMFTRVERMRASA